jgi:tetratricopeptide (TPR) repeat protein/predicted Ser/Thr protein kinase
MSELTGKTLGKYKVLGKIGAGGMGAVYKAMHIELGHTVAVKVLPSSFTRDPQYLERFHREAQTAAQLDGPHIIDVFDYGEQDGYTYLVMSYISGESLGDRLGQPMDTKARVDIISQVGEGLAFAHSRDVIHRDIKPDNILLTEDGQATIVDFGLARIREAVRITKTGVALGTAQYMSPEQIKGAKDIDHRTDIYSLGVVLYKMLTGQVPFQADSSYALMIKTLKDPVPSPRSLNSEIPLAVEAVILRALEKAPGARYQTVEEFVAALCEATRQPLPDWVEEARVKRPSKITTALRPKVTRRMGKSGLATFGIVIVVGLLTVGGFFAYRWYRGPQAAVHYSRGIVYLTQEQWALAINEFDEVLRIDPTYKDAAEKRDEAQKQLDLVILTKKCDDLYAKADWLNCILRCEEVRDLDSDYDQVEKKLFDAYYNYCLALVETDDLSGAVEQCNEALELDPEAAEVQAIRDKIDAYWKGKVAYNNEEWKIAIDALAYVYNTDPNFKDTQDLLYMAYVKYCHELVEAGNLEEARDCCEKALHIRPRGSEASACREEVENEQYLALVDKGNELLKRGKLDEAQAAFEEALDIQSRGAEAQDSLDKVYEARVDKGNDLLDDGKLDEAQAAFEEALDIQSRGAEAQDGLDKVYEAHVANGHELLDDCKCKEAKDEFDKALDIKSGGIEAQDGVDRYVDDCEEPRFIPITNSKDDYSGTQGYKNWYYLELIGTSWQQMPWDSGDGYYEHGYIPDIGSVEGRYIQIRQYLMHPGPDIPVARKWVSPVPREIRIKATVRKDDTGGGDGVGVRIMHNSQQLWSTYLHYRDSVGKTFTEDRKVQQGDEIYFIVDIGGSPLHDQTYFDASIYEVSYKCRPTD